VSDEQFGQAMAGDAIEHATRAVLEELVGFSPSPRDRATLGRVLKTTYRGDGQGAGRDRARGSTAAS
jgi:hypothetical protein